MKKNNIQKKNFKKYISLTLMLSGINVFGMDFPKNLNTTQNVAINSKEKFISELGEDLKEIVKLLVEMMKTPSYINTDYDLEQEFENYLKYIKSQDEKYRQNTDQFIIDNIEAILSQEFHDKINAGQNFPIKLDNQSLNFDDIFSMIIVINEICSEMLSKITKELTKKKKLIFSQRMISSLQLEIVLFEDIFKGLKKCLENILSKAQVENNDEILKYTCQFTSSIEENNETIKEIKARINALHKEDFEVRIYNLEKELKDAETTIKSLTQENKESRLKILAMNYTQELNTQLKELNKKLEEENKRILHEIDILLIIYTSNYNEYLELEDKMKNIINQNNINQNQGQKYIELQEELRWQQEIINNINEENLENQKKNIKLKKELTELKKQLKMQEKEEMQNGIVEAQNIEEKLEPQQEINDHQENLIYLEKKNREYEAILKELKARKEINDQNQKNLEKKNREYEAILKELKAQKEINDQNQEDLIYLEKKNREYEEILKELKAQKEINDQNQKNLIYLKKQNREYEAILKELKAQQEKIININEKNLKNQKENIKLKKELTELKKQLKMQEKEEMQNGIVEAQNIEEKLEPQKEINDQNQKNLEKKNREYEAILKELKAQKEINDQNQEDLIYLEKKNREYEAILKELKAQKEINDHQENLIYLEKKNREYEAILKELKAQQEKIININEKNLKNQKENIKLKKELTELKKQLKIQEKEEMQNGIVEAQNIEEKLEPQKEINDHQEKLIYLEQQNREYEALKKRTTRNK